MKKFVLLSIWLFSVQSISANKVQSIFDELTSEEVIEITLKTDLDQLITDKNKDEYQEASFTYTGKYGDIQALPVKVKARGKYRRRVCGFPPIKLNFPKGKLKTLGLSGEFDKLKLVTHCLDDEKASEQNIVKEWLAYKLYEQVSPYHLRTQLVKITYIDSNRPGEKSERYGILIEEIDQLAKRMNTKVIGDDVNNVDSFSINAEILCKVAVFQYMIGNVDWNPSIPRNIKLLESPNGYIPVPYDFDFAALVSPSYIRMSRDYGQKSIKDRVYLGHTTTYAYIEKTSDLFEEKRSTIKRLLRKAPLIRRSETKELINYVEHFYQELPRLKEMAQPILVKDEADDLHFQGEGK